MSIRHVRAVLPTGLAVLLLGSAVVSASGDQPAGPYDYGNANPGGGEAGLTASDAGFLRRAWETFNDDTFVAGPPPTGFILEGALGLVYPSPVVGVVAPPVIQDGTIYFVDELGTLFARDARTGLALDPDAHWTTTLADPDFAAGDPPIAPELFYTSPVVRTDDIWLIGSVYGQVHRIDRDGGAEFDFIPGTPEIDPFPLVPDRPVSSVLGTPVIVEGAERTLLVASVNVIVNDALFQDGETGLVIAFDITDPDAPVEAWRTRTIDVDPATSFPYGTGVSAGSSLVVDAQRGLIFGGTGQNTSAPYPEYPDPDAAPAGYVDRGDSVYAIDIETGEFVWTSQFHEGDVFDLNDPVSTGPNRPDGPRDADVLAPPVLFSARVQGQWRDLVGDGSKGGRFRVIDRDSGETVWQRQVSNPTGIGGIQGGAAEADGVLYVAGFEGIDDGFSDAQFGVSLDTGIYPNAFFATFSPAFWADVEDTAPDGDPATGMRVKVYALDAGTGRSLWHFPGNVDYVSLPAGAALRQVSVSGDVVFVATSSGRVFALRAFDGTVLFEDQTADLDELLDLGLGKPHHASMNGGSVVADGMVFVPSGAQNNPSGGLLAYEVNEAPAPANDWIAVPSGDDVVIDALANDDDPNGDALRFTQVAGTAIDLEDGMPDEIQRPFGTIHVVNPGDDPDDPEAAYLVFSPARNFNGLRLVPYTVEDLAPNRIVNGVELDEPNPTHVPRSADAWIVLVAAGPSPSR